MIGGGAGLIIAVIAMLLGVNPGEILNQGGAPAEEGPPLAANDTAGIAARAKASTRIPFFVICSTAPWMRSRPRRGG